MHWTGVLNLIALALASAVVGYLWFSAGWHWYFALPLWPVIYIGLPVSIGLIQGIGTRREMPGLIEKARRGEPLNGTASITSPYNFT
jgi:hypothetical protein